VIVISQRTDAALQREAARARRRDGWLPPRCACDAVRAAKGWRDAGCRLHGLRLADRPTGHAFDIIGGARSDVARPLLDLGSAIHTASRRNRPT